MAVKKKGGPLRSVPGARNRDAELDVFASAAGTAVSTGEDRVEKVYTWEEPHVRDDVMKQILLKMPEPMYLKLKHITNYTPYNMTSFILEKIAPEIEAEIAKMTGRT